MNDQVLMKYITEVFGYYDRDRTGFLQLNQLANFYNDLFTRMNDPRRLTQQQAYDYLRATDKNLDGRADINQLFHACRHMFAKKAYTGHLVYHQPVVAYQPLFYRVQHPQIVIVRR